MRRVRIVYGGREFTIPDVDTAEIRHRVDVALEGGDPWLEAVSGHGRGTPAHLLISPGVPIVLLDEVQETVADAGAVPEPDLLA